MRRKLRIALFGFASISTVLILINLLTTPKLLWAIVPCLALLWWPLGAFFSEHKNAKLLSILGSLQIILFLLGINLLFSPRVLWAWIPCLLVLWWPIAVFFGQNKRLISIIGSLQIIGLLVGVNLVFTPRAVWAFIPSFGVLWWPIAVYFGRNRKALSLLGSLHTIALIIGINAIYSPGYPWAMYVVFPILWWPISIFSGEKARTLLFSILSAVIISGYYFLINVLVEPRHRFWIYVAYGLLWWPLSLILKGKNGRRVLSIIFIPANFLFTLYVNSQVKDEYNWSVFLFGPIALYAVAILVGKRRNTVWFAVFGYISMVAYYGYVNYFVENRHPFIIYIAFALAWWPISMSFAKQHKQILRFSIVGYLLIAAELALINYVTTPHILWSIYPICAIAFWPLSVLAFGGKKRKEKKLQMSGSA